MKHHIEDTNKGELMVMGPGAGAKIYTSLWKKICKLTC